MQIVFYPLKHQFQHLSLQPSNIVFVMASINLVAIHYGLLRESKASTSLIECLQQEMADSMFTGCEIHNEHRRAISSPIVKERVQTLNQECLHSISTIMSSPNLMGLNCL